MKRFEVQHYTLCDGWVNTWSCWEDDSEESVPETFDSFASALMALDDFLEEEEQEFKEGNIESPYLREEFRIVEVCNG